MNSIKCKKFGALMQSFIAQIKTLNKEECAKFCFVSVCTLNKWINGYPPACDLLYRIARYFAPRVGMCKDEIFYKMQAVLQEWQKANGSKIKRLGLS